jgi:acyl carrier protein phosphodiesterase
LLRPSRTGWFVREELEERYGEEFVKALEAEASRLLEAQDSTIHKMADERFPAEDLAEASALLRVLFTRWMASEWERRDEGSRGT